MSRPRPLVLVILDGFGERSETKDNAVRLAKTPSPEVRGVAPSVEFGRNILETLKTRRSRKGGKRPWGMH
jgi:hypothetical protein